MTAKYLGAIDQGTTSTRFILFDRQGEPVAMHQVDLKNYFPQPGWQEQDPEDIIRSVFECIDGVLKQGYTVDQIASIGITNQRETIVVWDRNTGKPYCNTIVWCDTRTEHIVTSLITRYDHNPNHFQHLTGLPISTYFSLFKILWLMKNNTEVNEAIQSKTAMIGTVDSWILFCLTGKHRTDVTNASRTMMMNLHTLQWDQSICNTFHIPIDCLPTIHHNTFDFGTIQYGPLTGLHINGVLGDQQAALLGLGCLSPGDVKNTYGTGCFLLMNTGAHPIQSTHGLLTTVGFQLGENNSLLHDLHRSTDATQNTTSNLLAPSQNNAYSTPSTCHYALEGSVASCGSLLNWLCDSFRVASNPSELVDYAGLVQNNASVYIVPAFSGLLCPHWCPSARGIIIGLTRYSNYQHLCRAAIESIALQTLDVVEAMVEDIAAYTREIGTPQHSHQEHDIISSMKVDGGVSRSELLCAFQSDILNIPVQKAIMQERTALGAAIAAGLGSNYWTNIHTMMQDVGFTTDTTNTSTQRQSESPSSSPVKQYGSSHHAGVPPITASPASNGTSSPLIPVETPSFIENEVYKSKGFVIYKPQQGREEFRRTTRDEWRLAVEKSKGWAKM